MLVLLPERGDKKEEWDILKCPNSHPNLLKVNQIPSCRQTKYDQPISLKAAAESTSFYHPQKNKSLKLYATIMEIKSSNLVYLKALLNRKFHILQIFPPCEELVPKRHVCKMWNLRMVNFNNFLGLTSVLKFHIFLIFNYEKLVYIRVNCEGLAQFFSDVKN